MCGFVAVINSNLNKDNRVIAFNKLKEINTHRGPDEIKFLHKKNYSLLFRRLSIIDINRRSSQPFSSNDGKINLVFNGEIYNYLEIKEELKKKNYKFKTSSDTEVVLKSYECWGANFVKKLRGMFAIVIFDEIKKKYFCFRDRLGQKPLFFSKYQGGLIISSEIKDIVFFKKKNTIQEDKDTVQKYLLRGWCDDSNKTFFKDIISFPAGSVGIINKSSIKHDRYWTLEFTDNKQFQKEEFEQIFSENLKIHLRSDVPIAFTLSGGLDSSSLVKKSLDYSFSKSKSFSLNSKNKNENDEKKYINEFVKINSLNHSYLNLQQKVDKNILEKLIFFQDEPVSSTSFLNQFLLRKKIHKEGFKVLIVGEGGDEVLGGYNRMFIPYLYNVFIKNKKKIPLNVKKNISINLGKNFSKINKQIFNYKVFLGNDNDIEDNSPLRCLKLDSKNIPSHLKFYNPTIPSKRNSFKLFLLNHIFKRDLPHILRQEDRISMSQSIENRTPFVDHKLLEYIFSRDEKFFMLNGESKFMLRSIMKNKLPNSFFYKKKVGRPGDSSFIVFDLYYEKFLDLLSSIDTKNYNFDNLHIRSLIEKDKKKKKYENSNFYFRILNYILWKKNISNSIYLS
jgi:asparagine synthase (glutamine-hydrolysing)